MDIKKVSWEGDKKIANPKKLNKNITCKICGSHFTITLKKNIIKKSGEYTEDCKFGFWFFQPDYTEKICVTTEIYSKCPNCEFVPEEPLFEIPTGENFVRKENCPL